MSKDIPAPPPTGTPPNAAGAVRTFAGDLEALKRATPEASSIPKAEIRSELQAMPAAPLPQPPASVPTPPPSVSAAPVASLIPKPPVPTAPTPPPSIPPTPTPRYLSTPPKPASFRATAAERLIGTSPIQEASTVPPLPMPVPHPVPVAEKPKPPTGVSPIETYAGDFSARMKATNATAATVVAAEQDAATGSPNTATQDEGKSAGHSKATLVVVAVGILFLLLGGGGIYVVYDHVTQGTVKVAIAPAVATPIFVDSRETISGSGQQIVKAIVQETTNPLPVNTIRLLTMSTSSPVGVRNVFLAAQFGAPDILLRNIETSRSMAGIIRTNAGESPFFILSVDSYSATFSGMLKWEPTMLRSLGALFPPYPAPAVSTSTATSTQTASTATSTPAASSTTPTAIAQVPTPQPAFKDETVANHNVRVYEDTSGRSILMYGYWNPSTLVIARDAQAFSDILNRLETSR